LFDSVLVFDNYPVQSTKESRISGLEIRNVRTLERANCPLQLNAVPDSELMFRITYYLPQFEAPTITWMLERLKALLEKMGTGRRDKISSLSCVNEQEREELITSFNVNLEA